MKKSETFYCTEGSSDKIYTVCFVETDGQFRVYGMGGRRGGSLTEYKKYDGPDQSKAEKAYAAEIKKRYAKGYHPGEDSAQMNPTTHTTPPPMVDEYRPMLLNSIDKSLVDKLLNDSDWILEKKEDGVHGLIFVGNGAVAAYSRKKLPVTLSGAAAATLAKHFPLTILDGEVIGEHVVLFDILAGSGIDLRSSSCHARLELLTARFNGETGLSTYDNSDAAWVYLIRSACGTEAKKALLAELYADGAEGAVFKRLSSPYTAGRPSSGGDALKFKFKATCSLQVIAVGTNGKDSVDVALASGRQVSSVSTIGKTVPPIGSIIEVEYLYAHRNGGLIQPIYLNKIRTDVDVDGDDDLQYKGEER